jgi:hypothetical protein
MTNENVKEIASIAWKGAANAHRMYPENKHTFSEYWNGAESQFNKFCQPDVSGEFAAFRKFVKDLIGSTEYDVIEKEWEKQAANFR